MANFSLIKPLSDEHHKVFGALLSAADEVPSLRALFNDMISLNAGKSIKLFVGSISELRSEFHIPYDIESKGLWCSEYNLLFLARDMMEHAFEFARVLIFECCNAGNPLLHFGCEAVPDMETYAFTNEFAENFSNCRHVKICLDLLFSESSIVQAIIRQHYEVSKRLAKEEESRDLSFEDFREALGLELRARIPTYFWAHANANNPEMITAPPGCVSHADLYRRQYALHFLERPMRSQIMKLLRTDHEREQFARENWNFNMLRNYAQTRGESVKNVMNDSRLKLTWGLPSKRF